MLEEFANGGDQAVLHAGCVCDDGFSFGGHATSLYTSALCRVLGGRVTVVNFDLGRPHSVTESSQVGPLIWDRRWSWTNGSEPD